MELKTLLKLQFIYCLFGILFNLISWGFIENGYQALAPTLPLGGIIVMALYGVFVLTGFFGNIKWYRCLMFISIIILGYGGVVKHILTLHQNPEVYYSFFSGFAAILINLFGLVLNCVASMGKLKL